MESLLVKSSEDFKNKALNLFRFQFEHNKVYRTFCDLTNRHPSDVKNLNEIPFLPIELFKTHQVISVKTLPKTYFVSSGTTGKNSRHWIHSTNLYEDAFKLGFSRVYGDPSNWVIMGLLPSYLEQKNASLVYMVDRLIKASGHEESGFFLDNYEALNDNILWAQQKGKKCWIIGVSYALLDWASKSPINLGNAVLVETGGMKGRRQEITRAALHQELKHAFGLDEIHSEYGMTELLSQAYATKDGVFQAPPWMKIRIRSTENPMDVSDIGSGCLNIIDLANKYSCAFIATQDLGKKVPNGGFEVLGRFDHADIRGCNLMVN